MVASTRNRGSIRRTALTLSVLFGASLAASLAATSPALAGSAWVAPQPLGEGILATSIASDEQGNVLAASLISDGTNDRVNVQSRGLGGSFGAPVPLSARGANAQEQSVAFDSKGDAMVVWERTGVIQETFRPAGGSFGPVEDVSPGNQGSSEPMVIFDSKDNAVVMWIASTGIFPAITTHLESNERPAGGSFGVPVELDSVSTTTDKEMAFIFPARLVADAQGDVFAAWSLRKESGEILEGTTTTSIRAAVRAASGVFSPSTTLESAMLMGTIGAELGEPKLAADPEGSAMVVWEHQGFTESHVEGKLRPAGGEFETTAENISGIIPDSFEPAIAFEPNGDVVAAWVGVDEATAGIYAATRPSGGSFESAQLLSETGVSSGSPVISTTSKRTVIVAWVREDATSRIETAARPLGGSFGEPVPISPDSNQYSTSQPSLMVDGVGDAVAFWRRAEGANILWEVAGYDDSSPFLESLMIPTTGAAGTPVPFSVSPLDTWSALGATTWAFGDGTTASGTSVTHTYAAAGHYTVTVSSTDVLGNQTSTSGAIVVGPAPPPPPKKTLTPTITSASQSHSRWREGKKAATFSRKRKTPVGTVFSFGLNEQAPVSLTFILQLTGREAKGKCVAHTSKHRHGRACMRTVLRGKVFLTGHSGTNRVFFDGVISRTRKLPLGRYKVVIAATQPLGKAAQSKSLSFTIVK